MKILHPFRFAAGLALVAAFAAGCGHIDTTPAGDPDRVLTGAVRFNATLPAGAEVVVRVIEPPGNEPLRAAANDLPVAARPPMPRVERVLGEHRQTLASGTMQPVPFQIEYHAEDAALRRGLNVEARISIGGKVRYRTIHAHVLTLTSAPFKQDVSVQPVN